MVKRLEQTIKQESVRECKWCGEKYDFKKRQEEVRKKEIERGITTRSHATEYCTNQCWIEADKAYCC